MLNLRYNEMWSDWDGNNELQEPKKFVHDQLVLSWRRLNVSVKLTTQHFCKRSKITYTQILQNVSGNVQRGNLLGIMGPSGSGKTTLMATISQRNKGNFDGELLLNGQPISEEVMIKISGFVPQLDIISFNELTVLEHLTLMANLKMDRHTSKTILSERVNHVVTTLGMYTFLNTRISFLSGGERKKVALAVQLLNDPLILFCDEITTGLDSYSAAHVVNTLRNVARTGKIVICTIHQPASGVFWKFDEIVLLTKYGQLAYQGPVFTGIQFFKKFNYECPTMFNEADFIISVLNSDSEKVKKDIKEMCKLSSKKNQINPSSDIFNNQKTLDTLQHLQTKKPEWRVQFKLMLGRSIKCFFRSYQYKLLDLGNVTFVGVLLSSTFANIKSDTINVQNWMGFWLLFAIQFIYHFSYSSITVYQDRFSIVHQEVHSKVYLLSAYYISEFIIWMLWLVIKMLFFCTFAFWIIGADWSYMQFLVFFSVAMASFSYGILLSAFIYDIDNLVVFKTTYNFISLTFSGVFLSFKSLPTGVYSLRHLSLFFYGCETISILFWAKIKSISCVGSDNCLKNGEAVLNNKGYTSHSLIPDLMILITFSVLSNVISYLRILKRMKKSPVY